MDRKKVIRILANILYTTIMVVIEIFLAIKRAIESVFIFFKNNWIYLVWFSFYFTLFWIITDGISSVFYFVSIPLALSPIAEEIWRLVSGVRPLRVRTERQRLLPLFKEVYTGARKADPRLSKRIRLYIKEDMTINAFAFGRSTLVLTRGSIELLDDECLQGLMAHELGHFSCKHTQAILITMVGNLPMTILNRKLADIKNHYSCTGTRKTLIAGIFIIFFDFLYYICRALEFIGELILMYSRREHEYNADWFALHSGFGEELRNVLKEIYSVSISKPETVREQLKSTHPHITRRIEELETVII